LLFCSNLFFRIHHSKFRDILQYGAEQRVNDSDLDESQPPRTLVKPFPHFLEMENFERFENFDGASFVSIKNY
jgi:hypothetical protein